MFINLRWFSVSAGHLQEIWRLSFTESMDVSSIKAEGDQIMMLNILTTPIVKNKRAM
ncbi:MAG: hypothetical protein M3342_25195 [Bacteroidota bacterium]|nr:hypothetical protein [Bacteroidota bacterium]